MSRNTVARIDLAAIRSNLAVVRNLVGDSQVACVVKADAYGHGLKFVLAALDDADILAVATVGEAQTCRDLGWQGRLLMLEGPSSLDECIESVALSAEMVIHHESQFEHLERIGGSEISRLWLKIDSGMHRLGFPPGNFSGAYQRLAEIVGGESLVLMSHFAVADDAANPMTKAQMGVFDQVIEGREGMQSLANSAGIFNFPEAHRDIVRPGIVLYGASPCGNVSALEIGLKPAMTLCCDIIAINPCKRGEPVGYGAIDRCPEDMNVAVAAIGYGDGYPRSVKTGTPVLVNGRRAPLIGRVSMDMITIDLRQHPETRVGDQVTLWGEGLPVEEIAKCAGAIPYELICAVTSRVRYEISGA